ncbi:hypothetical protein PC129_g21641 [Phytophthora cactorum]|uniref:Uncharacterized protein n=2 Tax=Phytophthora cactorum TaxID=29920 RepID=A0A8T1AJ08_9STRA|nr:hypothetical protein PC111_g20476 [Phytophthora cactorum]KAG2875373.1 hypothetical protein PC114_g24761 [Phytophthora cactorum]KAG2882136.1 hypothetical protein PC115_g22040 [Phytophthora cactorum]KAG2967114.1 hypothetical protein PC118_g18780 [Phytophthora cactorum]KAG2967946.1 hypothetical protein PC119_g24333 [Phytophthora cactorum]
MMFVGASEPSSYIFPLGQHASASDLPGEKTYSQDEAILFWENLEANASTTEEPATKRVRGRPNVSKYINDAITKVTARVTKASAPLPPDMTAGLTCHSLHRGSAAYANASPKVAIQWISTRGAWLLDSLTKAFAYVGTATREDQSAGQILAGHNDPHLPCVTPSQLFKNVSGFTDASLNIDEDVLDAVIGSLLIHQEEVSAAVTKAQAATGQTSHYIYRFYVALDDTNAALGSGLTLATCVGWGQQLRTACETDNFAQLKRGCGGDTAVLTLAITQMLTSIAATQRSLTKLVALQERKGDQAVETQSAAINSATPHVASTNSSNIVAEAHSLIGCFYNWYTLQLWHTATQNKQQFVRASLKACINVMIITAGKAITVSEQPIERDGVSYRLWKHSL